ncbi:MAG: hypothetical protein KJZ83_15670 [Burkholderiaceae bacterium]|nr:hypothetical protein [Burkholderiaceae bacterium]
MPGRLAPLGSVSLDQFMRRAILRLCDERALPPGAVNAAPVDPALLALPRQCFDAGWIGFDEPR